MTATRQTRTLSVVVGLVVAIAVSAAIPAAAVADADPASDFLLVTPVFYPYQPRTAPALKKTLETTLTTLKAKGLNLKVAILDNATDLGGVTNLWNMPQPYADFLDREISFNTKQPLLVVMPAGFGVANAGPTGALNGLVVDSARSANGLARSAILAVVRLAKANGKPIPAPVIPAVSGSSKGGGSSAVLTFGAPVALVVLVAAVTALLRRRTAAEEEEEEEE